MLETILGKIPREEYMLSGHNACADAARLQHI